MLFYYIHQTICGELRTIKSDKQLLKIYDGDEISSAKRIFTNLVTMPFSAIVNGLRGYSGRYIMNSSLSDVVYESKGVALESVNDTVGATSKEYSTTNIQVENVDEADITKTDGDYIYSISDNNVIITNSINPENIKIEATIAQYDGCIPEELIIYKNKLVVINSKNNNSTSYYGSRYNSNTVVKIYNIENKAKPVEIKSYELYEPYYTSRCIDNELYVIASGNLKKEQDVVTRKYREDNKEKDIPLNSINYLKEVKTRTQSIISVVDLDNPKSDVRINSYLIDISNAYVSENSIYLLNTKYDYDEDMPKIRDLFGIKGIIGVLTYDDYSSGYKTEIYKFDISKNGSLSYKAKTKIEGRTINQYSLDEKDGHLRIALYDNDGARVVILDNNLKQIGISDYVAKGETMYSSRFIGDKAYLVTFKNMDPLFVIDLSDETKPKVLGELKIPGYSTYLHPYDENHLIGIGMETEEVVNRNSSGKVVSTTTKIIGMKMALFDVTDVNNPTQISQTVIGDRRTTSAILTNPKALLFSKKKQLIAIPVNNYNEDFEVSSSSDSYTSMIDSYKKYNKNYVAEGYFVYNINLEEGFKLKGIITHEKSLKNKYNTSNYYYNNSKLLRGLYIDNNLYTVSESAIKVNNLDTLELIKEIKIK